MLWSPWTWPIRRWIRPKEKNWQPCAKPWRPMAPPKAQCKNYYPSGRFKSKGRNPTAEKKPNLLFILRVFFGLRISSFGFEERGSYYCTSPKPQRPSVLWVRRDRRNGVRSRSILFPLFKTSRYPGLQIIIRLIGHIIEHCARL